ncbi:uncharacterized protein C9orf85 homolog isoform X4 [Sceloporus undulatus]|uniref:uncharacterized protein C9orf85 homolog isoform X4 n=1 Tax=Sceloporus undulatus TaxID=8520 RepID=UPI001C4D3A57|nr:uncharacterized protein C9orf85 homolog isoform X4 [Sceloporus undulatus]
MSITLWLVGTPGGVESPGSFGTTASQQSCDGTRCKTSVDSNFQPQKKINAKVHEGLCQRCKEVLEWRVKFNKYKPLTQPKKCVKCLQKTVKDSYHVICKPCACELDLCAKCGKREEIVIPIYILPFSHSEIQGGNATPDETPNIGKKEKSGHNVW